MVNTINNYNYNTAERKKLYAEYETLHNNFLSILKAAGAAENSEEHKKLHNESQKISELSCKAYLKCFAAQFHKCKNEWFLQVVEGLPDGEFKRISQKQYDYFCKYAYDTDCESWKTGNSYCRVGDYLITLNNHWIKKESLK